MIDVLVYDPDLHLRSVLEKACKKTEFYLKTTQTPTKLLEICKKTPPELVVLNFISTEGKGLELCETIKLQHRNTRSGVIPLVDTDQWRDLLKMYQSGISATLKLPLQPEVILDTFRNVQMQKYSLLKDQVMGNWVHFNLSSSLTLLNSIQTFIADLLKNTPLDLQSIQSLIFALNEFLLNGIEHGNHYDIHKKLDIHYVVFEDKLVIKISDEGDGFSFSNLPNPLNNPKTVAEEREKSGKRPGGYGIAVSRMYVDDVFYNDTGNTLILTKNFPK